MPFLPVPQNLVGPFDANEYIARVPAHVTCKGMFFSELQNTLKSKSASLDEETRRIVAARFVAFRDYPLAEHMRLTAGVVPVLFPHATTRQGLRELGWRAYPTFAKSLAGRVAVGLLGDNINRVLDVSSQAIQLSLSTGSVKASSLGERCYQLSFEKIYGYLDSYYVGVVEGALRFYGIAPQLEIKLHTPVDGIFRVCW